MAVEFHEVGDATRVRLVQAGWDPLPTNRPARYRASSSPRFAVWGDLLGALRELAR